MSTKCAIQIKLLCVTNVIGSGSYQKAIQDVKSLFPEGLCCTETSTMRREQVWASHTGLNTWVVLPTDKRQTFCVCVWFLGSDTQHVLRPVILCGAWTELHTGPCDPGTSDVFDDVRTKWGFGLFLVLFSETDNYLLYTLITFVKSNEFTLNSKHWTLHFQSFFF